MPSEQRDRPPKPDITVSVDHDLVEDLNELKRRRSTDRSAEITAGCMVWVNEAIRNGTLDREYLWDVEEHHADASSVL